uniref:Uncharacterized protein n=2 Tax=Anopheles triannulatus TaxID=58253 RepID=A0A2M4AN28_9DIPT
MAFCCLLVLLFRFASCAVPYLYSLYYCLFCLVLVLVLAFFCFLFLFSFSFFIFSFFFFFFFQFFFFFFLFLPFVFLFWTVVFLLEGRFFLRALVLHWGGCVLKVPGKGGWEKGAPPRGPVVTPRRQIFGCFFFAGGKGISSRPPPHSHIHIPHILHLVTNSHAWFKSSRKAV